MFGIVCAHNPGKRNLGMYSVDLAAQQFFSGHDASFDLVKLVGHPKVGALHYTKTSTLDRYDRIVFWGDFQQNPIWGSKAFAPRARKEWKISHADALEAWKAIFLGKRPSSTPLYSIGTCFLGTDQWLQNNPFAEEYVDLLSRFELIAPRDTGSFAILKRLGLRNIVQGFDCASLIDHGTIPGPRPRQFAHAFGRSLKPDQAAALVRQIEKITGYRGVGVEWLLPKYHLGRTGEKFSKAMKVVAESEFVVTDIYHLTINSIHAGRRVFCVGDDDAAFDDTCDDYKKYVLMEMLGVSGDYEIFRPGDDIETLAKGIAAQTAEPRPLPSRFSSLKANLADLLRDRMGL